MCNEQKNFTRRRSRDYSSFVFVYSPSAHIPVVCKVMMQQNTCVLIYHNRSHERQRRSMLGSVMGVQAPPRTLALRICRLCIFAFGSYTKCWARSWVCEHPRERSPSAFVLFRLSSFVFRLSSKRPLSPTTSYRLLKNETNSLHR